LLTEELEDTKG